MYTVIIGLKDEGKYETFPEAFRALYEKVTAEIAENVMALQITIWIESEIDGRTCPLTFSEAGNLAYNIGLISEDGKLQEITIGDYENALISARIHIAMFRYIIGQIRIREEMAATLALLRREELIKKESD